MGSADWVSSDGNSITLKPEPEQGPSGRAFVVCDGPCRTRPHVHLWTPGATTLLESLDGGSPHLLVNGNKEKWLKSIRPLTGEEKAALRSTPLGRKPGKKTA